MTAANREQVEQDVAEALSWLGNEVRLDVVTCDRKGQPYFEIEASGAHNEDLADELRSIRRKYDNVGWLIRRGER
jgi:hypothetical protein